MAINKQFESYKLKRELLKSGIKVVIQRNLHNEFGEPLTTSQEIGTVKGLYHEESGYIQLSTQDNSQTRSKKVPKILCLFDEVSILNVKVGDFCIINSKLFKITGITNIQEWNIIGDISLEVVDNGNSIQV